MSGFSTDWSFVGVVLIITLGIVSALITILYYCWIHQVLTTLTSCLKVKSQHQKKETLFDVHSSSVDIETLDPVDSYKNEVLENTLPLPNPLSTHQLGVTDKNRNRSVTGNTPARVRTKETKQRSVNKALHALKVDSHGTISVDGVPQKPDKSDAVRSYTTLLTQPIPSGSDSNGDQSEEYVNAAAHAELPAPAQTRNVLMTYRYQKWSKIKPSPNRVENESQIESGPPEDTNKMEEDTKSNNNINDIMTSPKPAIYKIGRSARAMASENSNQSTRHRTKHRMYPYVKQIVNANLLSQNGNKKKRMSSKMKKVSSKDNPDSLYNVLLAMRKSGDIGLNYLNDSVPKVITRKKEASGHSKPSDDQFKKPCAVIVSLDSDKVKNTPQQDDSSQSDEIKSLSSTSDPEYQNKTDEIAPKLDTSVPVFGTMPDNNTNIIQDTKEIKVRPIDSLFQDTKEKNDTKYTITETETRPIDSLFCSSSPSTDVSENIFISQNIHNITEADRGIGGIINNLDLSRQDPQKDSQFLPNDLSSSLASTSLPSILSSSPSITSTLTLSSEDNNFGQLKFFEEL